MDLESGIMECKMELEETINAWVSHASRYKILDIIIAVPEEIQDDREKCVWDRKM
jgi:hypothetical protein